MQHLLLIQRLLPHLDKRTQHPSFILEGKAQVESSKGDGGSQEATSLSPSPATLPLTHTESPGAWQSESLMAESWSTMGDMDPEDTKSLDSSDGAALMGEENHSSNSDMVHLEHEDAEMLEEAEKAGESAKRMEEEEEEEEEDLQTSVLSVLGGERELRELRAVEEDQDLHAPETEELLVSAEEPQVEREPAELMQVVPPMALPALPIVKLHPPSITSTPAPSTTTSEAEEPYSTQGLHPPCILAPLAAAGTSTEGGERSEFSPVPLRSAEEHLAEASTAASGEATTPAKTKPLSSTELLCGGAVVVAIVGVVAYGAVAYCKK